MAFFACDNDEETFVNLEGHYVGIFERGEKTSNVELTLNNRAFNGQSEIVNFPALCNGTYTISGNKIAFINHCIWTADFDWTLVLGGEWTFILHNDILIMTNSQEDKYTLVKQ